MKSSIQARLVAIAFAIPISVTMSTRDAAAVCQDICFNSPNGNCISNADCTGGGNYCFHISCCDQDEEDAALGECACGDTIEGDVTLKHDIVCGSGNGLIVDEENEDLNLDGHKIACTGSGGSCGSGVTLTASNTSVFGSEGKGGRIEGFYVGVLGEEEDSGTLAKQLTITDAGLDMTHGIEYVAAIRRNLISGAAAGSLGGAGIEVGSNCTVIADNLITDSTRGISIGVSNGGTSCDLNHNRAVGNDYGLAVYYGNLASASADNLFINNSVNDYTDQTQRLNASTNVCRVAYSGLTCSLEDLEFIP